jgi:hypothetical protein
MPPLTIDELSTIHGSIAWLITGMQQGFEYLVSH